MKLFGLNVVLVCVAQEVAWIMCFLLLVLMVPIVCVLGLCAVFWLLCHMAVQQAHARCVCCAALCFRPQLPWMHPHERGHGTDSWGLKRVYCTLFSLKRLYQSNRDGSFIDHLSTIIFIATIK